MPENVSLPLNDAAPAAPVTCPSHITDDDCHVPVTFAPDCVSVIVICAVGLLDEANVPLQFPAMLTGVPPEEDAPPDPDEGSTEVPPHADRYNAAQMRNA